MRTGEEDSGAQEIIIVRRRGDEEHGHHGGAWKIAYADFMTAMMAFFLVMWLINSSDEKTLTQVAAYFNPLKLTDKNPMPKGVHEMHDPEHGDKPEDEKEKKKKKGKEKPSEPKEKAGEEKEKKAHQDNTGSKEETLFSDPYGVLARLAGEADITKTSAGENRPGSGEAFRDPFDPAFTRQPTPDARVTAPNANEQKPQDAMSPGPSGTFAGSSPLSPSEEMETVEDSPRTGNTQSKDPADKDKTGIAPPPGTPPAGESDKPPPPGAAPAQKERAAVESEIAKALRASSLAALPNVEVTLADGGVLICLTDSISFSMFDSASAQPRPEMVVAMEKIGKVLAARKGTLVLRGHTDSRPFKAGNYDNWRLSTARAHMAYYMLVRGGVQESRVERVEGYADRVPKLPNAPEAPPNRRIEILLREPKT